ncbi:lipopolysaccharide biosynthesis protein [Rhodocytophaga rosea]|uniref:Lipopolysaccharide biosynthesis protein n=1 Tax=Rhodocytophaga rosea TaxID=2704465 RepID=A0A6C0GVM7_9BACT|nr:lipopolysaccharide biosynthesis protein [Rhodocytophaga rosea]QHT71362.1 lipopolysaccharide biosynthesis protein [Rhodocytophaga rosea]
MSVLKKLAGETALYGLSSIVGRLLNYLLVPLHTAVFAPAEFGVNAKLYAYVAFFNVLYTYGLETAYFRFASKAKDENYYNVALSSIILSSSLLSGLIIILSPQIANALGYPDRDHLVRWLAIIIAIDAIVAIPFARLRLQKKAKTFALARMANILLTVFLNIFFLIFCKDIYEGKYLQSLKPLVETIYFPSLGIGYIVLSNLIANAAFFLLLYRSFLQFRFRLDKQILQSMWIYAYPILIMSLAGTTNLMTDRILLETFLPENFYPGKTPAEALGIYAGCYKLSIFMTLAIQAFRYAAEPFFFSQSEDKNAPGTFALVTKWFIIVCVLIWLGVSVNLDIIGLFLRSKDYREGLAVVPVLLLANLFLGVYYNLSVWFKLSDKTYYGTYITLTGAAITVIGNMLLIPVFGYMGCAYTFLLSCIVMTVLCYTLGNKYYPVPYDIKSAVTYIISAALLIYIGFNFPSSNQVIATAFHLFLCLVFAAIVFVMERSTFRSRKVW